MDFKEQHQIAESEILKHWYYRSKFRLLWKLLDGCRPLPPDAKLADCGCGIGVFLTLLEQSGLFSMDQMVGIDPAASPNQRSIGGKVEIHTEWPSHSFDIILLMDVLEHIRNDTDALHKVWEKLKPGGYLVVTVPAFPFLWSSHDRNLGHYRRYTISSLSRLLNKVADLKIIRSFYFFALILPIAVIVRWLQRKSQTMESDLKPASPAVSVLLTKGLLLELFFAPINRVAGLTVVALCQKQ